MVITHNLTAMNAMGKNKLVTEKVAKSAKKLSSGFKINSAADDAAGLSISEKMRSQIRGLEKASTNAEDGISLIQIAEGALNEVHDMLDRMKELSVQAANDTNTDIDRKSLQAEIDELTKEIDKIGSTTQYNTMNVFSPSGVTVGDIDAGGEDVNIEIELNYVDGDGNVVSLGSSTASGTATSYSSDPNMNALANDVARAARKAVSQMNSAYGNLFTNSSSGIKVGLNLANIDGVHNTLASARLSMIYNNVASSMKYTLNVDTSDFPASGYNVDKLEATIAHEMTHLVMYDTLTNGMLDSSPTKYPGWFVEGMAQTSSGDNGWMSTLNATVLANPTGSDGAITNYLSQVTSMPYGAGYLATTYLAYKAAGGGTVSTATLQTGVNKIMTDLSQGKTLDEVVKTYTTYANASSFANGLAHNSDAIQYTKDFINARGATGAGSLIAASLATNVAGVISGDAAAGNYSVVTGNTQFENVFGAGHTLPAATEVAGDDGAGWQLQVGAQEGQTIHLKQYNITRDGILKENLDVLSHTNAAKAINLVDKAIDRVSTIRSYYGAIQNRLEHTIKNLDNTAENTQAAESKLRDADMAEEMVEYAKNNILNQASQSMLANAYKQTEGVLNLLQ